MSPEAQRAAIAEVRGWTYPGSTCLKLEAWSRWNPPAGWRGRRVVPDYLNDLNAMHEAEKVLDATNGGPESGDCLRYAYSRWVYGKAIVPTHNQPFRATAAQRAEAFLRTLGKWDDSK